MAEMKKVLNQLLTHRGKREDGYTMMEILVAIALLAVLTVVVTSTIINATQTSDKFTRGTMNEAQLLNAVSLITRDVSLANKITYAGDNALSVNTLEGNSVSNVSYFYWDLSKIPSKPDTIAGEAAPADPFAEVRAHASLLPTQPGIVEYRIVNGNTAAPIVRNLVEGYNPGGNNAYQLFTYFDTKNKEILLDASSSPHVANNKLDGIRRVEIHFTSYIDGRDNAMEIKTSATPRFLGKSITNQAGAVNLVKLQKPLLYGHLVPRSRTANIWWTGIAGADSYTIYRSNRLATPQEAPLAIVNGTDTTYTDTNVEAGETYTYRIVAHGFIGDSDSSDAVRLRVTPDATNFVNINPTYGQNGESLAGYTVARNLTNQLSWKASTGENIKYRLYGVVGGTPTILYDGSGLTFSHGSRGYGDVTRYYVVAYNDTIQSFDPANPSFVTGGTAPDSPYLDLVSPPKAAVITGKVLNDLTSPTRASAFNLITITNDSANPNAVGYDYKAGTSNTTTTSSIRRANVLSYEDSVAWGSTRYYSVTPYNNAGDGPKSNVVGLDQIPGPFNITSLSNPTGYAWVVRQDSIKGSLQKTETRGLMSAGWDKSSGASNYDLTRNVADFMGGSVISKSLFDYETDKADVTSTSTTFAGVHPGVIYAFNVSAQAANGETRVKTAKLLTRPDVPQRGIAEQMCLANGQDVYQDYAGYVEADTRPKYGKASTTDVSYMLTRGTAPSKKTGLAITSSNFQWVENPGLNNDVTISFQNVINANEGTSRGATFGLSDSERRSYALDINLGVVSQFVGACNTTSGGKVISKAAAKNGSPWIIPVNVCYGYRSGHDYSQYYVDPNNPWAAGYVYNGPGYQSWMVRRGIAGCAWRYDPVVGTDPYWQSQ